MTREEAAQTIHDLIIAADEGEDGLYLWSDQIEALETAIEALKQPEQKKGKWLSHYEYLKREGFKPSGLITFWWCNQCEHGVEHATNFCPNCGAKIEGEE